MTSVTMLQAFADQPTPTPSSPWRQVSDKMESGSSRFLWMMALTTTDIRMKKNSSMFSFSRRPSDTLELMDLKSTMFNYI